MLSAHKGITELTEIDDCNDTSLLNRFTGDNRLGLLIRPKAIIKPKAAQEVESVVQWANRTHTPLIPVSSGAPHYRDDTAPSIPEAVIVDFKDNYIDTKFLLEDVDMDTKEPDIRCYYPRINICVR